jgi:hypothetical protein
MKEDRRRLPVSSDIRIYLLLLAYVEYFIRNSLYNAPPTTETLVTPSPRLSSLIISRG